MIGKAITGKMLIGVGVAFAGLLATLGTVSWKLLDSQRDLGKIDQQLTQCESANQNQTQELRKVSARLTACTEEVAISQRAVQEYLRQRDRSEARRREALDQARRDRQALYERQPECAELAQLELCSDTDTRIRDRLEALKSGP
jgi:chromosome segregation ATPase